VSLSFFTTTALAFLFYHDFVNALMGVNFFFAEHERVACRGRGDINPMNGRRTWCVDAFDGHTRAEDAARSDRIYAMEWPQMVQLKKNIDRQREKEREKRVSQSMMLFDWGSIE
jgi:hypothetical protein